MRYPLYTGLISALYLSLTGLTTSAAESDSRTALVLGGGGARGAAHIGVLEVLEREQVPIDCIVGTSMGALVAGAYAAGLSPAQMREKLAEADWASMFLDAADYAELNYRTKQTTEGLLTGTKVRITKKGLQIRSGVVDGEKIKLFFNQLVGDDLGGRNIEELRFPLAIVATDIGTGQRVVLNHGSLTHAMRASMSVPGFMAPVEYQGTKLVDGGLIDNLPVALGRELCQADRVIAVNVGTPLKPADEVNSLLNVTVQMVGILTQQNVAQSVATLTERDIYITPQLGDISAADFSRYNEAANIGFAAADQHAPALQRFSVSEASYARWQAEHQETKRIASNISEITISPLTRANPIYIRSLLRQQTGEPLDRHQLEEDLIRIYGTGGFDNVDYHVDRKSDGSTLTINAIENDWISDYFTFGFNINEEHRTGAEVNLRAAYRNTWMNSYGGEFFALADIGTNSQIKVEFYQPLTPRQTYFIEPQYSKQREEMHLFLDDDEIAQYDLNTTYWQVLLGRNLGIWGQTSLGWRQYSITGDAEINWLGLPSIDEQYDGWLLETAIDKRNRLYFPSRGWSGALSYFNSHEQEYQKFTADLSGSYPWGDYILGARSSYVTAINGELPFFDAAVLGGFLNLSGYATNQIWAEGAIYAQLRAEKIIGRMPLGISGDLRLGAAFEGAKLDQPITLTENPEEWLNSAVIYLGGETPLGPMYLGYGFTFSGDFNIYFQLGGF